jgi:glyoxylase-like metal-dependent hydrolase (beta-lactamase superfamily II)
MSQAPSTAQGFLITGSGVRAIAPGLWVLHGQGNSFVAETAAGLVLVDAGPGGQVTRGMIEGLRSVSDRPLHAICFSHGHLGYNSGLPLWLAHASERGDPPPRVIAHQRLPLRTARYRDTMALQERMAELQFRRPAGSFRGKFPPPEATEVFDERLVLGGEADPSAVELVWSPSETDDAIAVWCPAQRVLYGGPAVIDSIPNLGTPFRTQRDTARWATTLERLAALRPDRVVREFGPELVGEDEVQAVLLGTARALRWVRDEVVRLMNQGLGERQILEAISYPPELFERPWMQPTYGDPDWIVRDVYRSENGWWDRNPTHLHPAATAQVSAALASAITDKQAVLEQAQALADAGRHQLALHVIDLLATLQDNSGPVRRARELKAAWLRERASQVRSYVSKSLYHGCAELLEQGRGDGFGVA